MKKVNYRLIVSSVRNEECNKSGVAIKVYISIDCTFTRKSIPFIIICFSTLL